MMQKFEVVLELEIKAETPEQAATIARDMMLNPDEELLFDVHPMSYDEAFDGYLPNRKVGWQARFEKRGSVRPSDMINWYTLER